ncbi:MAG: Stk1 family Ser/Thr kinase [Bacillota bacterium]
MRLEGKKLGGRYKVQQRVGGGGMANVYKAKDLLLHRFVAIKVLSEALSDDSEFVRRFSREAQAAASLSHPNVVSVYDVGREKSRHYIVMELVEGPTLKEYILKRAPLSLDEFAVITTQICEALAHAHENTIIHRDIKPHNILLGFNGRVKVTDFGIARAASSATITQTGSIMGSVHYFSPEQARGGTIGEKSDIYSLGVIMYEMLTGKLPFIGDSAVSIALKHLQDPPSSIIDLNPEINKELSDIVLKALTKEPEGRQATAQIVAQDIKKIIPAKETEELWFNFKNTKEEKGLVRNAFVTEAASKVDITFPANKENTQVVSTLAKKIKDRFQNVVGTEPTILQRTATWLKRAKHRLPWWQKALFTVVTGAVVLVTVVFGVFFLWRVIYSHPAQGTYHLPRFATVAEAKEWLNKNEFLYKVPSIITVTGPSGKVVEQNPVPGADVSPDTMLSLKVGKGASLSDQQTVADGQVTVDNFIGMFESRVRGLRPEGYNVVLWRSGEKGPEDPSVRQYQVYKQSVAPGSPINQGETVELYLYEPGLSGRKKA